MLYDILLGDPRCLRAALGLTAKQAALRYGVSLPTWYRWESNGAPAHIIRCMRYESGHLPGWEGFIIKPDCIITPGGETVHQNQINLYWYMVRLKCDQASPPLREQLYALIENAA